MRLLDTIQQHRDDEPLMSRIAATFGLVAVVMLSVTLLRMNVGYVFAAPQQTPVPQAERASSPPAAAEAAILNEKYERLLTEYGAMKTACMNGALRITWHDQHTGFDYAAICDVVKLGRISQ